MKYSVDWKAVTFLVLILGAPGLLWLADVDPRPIGWQLAAVAMGALFIRLIGWFHETPTGMRVFATLMILTLGLSAAAQWLAQNGDQSTTWVTYCLVSQRLLCIVCAIYWTRWTETKVSPFVRPRA